MLRNEKFRDKNVIIVGIFFNKIFKSIKIVKVLVKVSDLSQTLLINILFLIL